MSIVNGASSLVWGRGYLKASPTSSSADDVPFAELQNVEITSQLALEELMSPSQLTAAAVAVKEHKVTGSAEYAKVRARQFHALRGGSTPSVSGGKTTVDIGVNDQPVVFDLHLTSPSDGSDLEMIVYGCICTSLDLKVQLNNFVIPKFQFTAYGNGTNLLRIILPGDQTSG
ncbi:hypothetical protein LBMAG21_08640 [Armatimonadota bacterium]|nr:hypothetical protein LBMAG21_08640 [Armatimonadota bacterium]